MRRVFEAAECIVSSTRRVCTVVIPSSDVALRVFDPDRLSVYSCRADSPLSRTYVIPQEPQCSSEPPLSPLQEQVCVYFEDEHPFKIKYSFFRQTATITFSYALISDHRGIFM